MTETDPVAERPRVHVGLTGGIAAGKSAVARVLQERGALLVDSDALARLVLEKGTDGLAAVQDEFGDRVITADGELDRVEMARIVFGDEGARQRLNRIVHPRIRAAARRIVAARAQRPFTDLADLCLRAGLDAKARQVLAEADALRGLAGHRNAARWAVAGIEQQRPLLPGSPVEATIALPAPATGEEILSDYRTLGLSLGPHPMALLRAQMTQRRIVGLRELQHRPHGSGVHVAGLVTQRQRPATAKGTIFVTLEDETGMINVIVWARLAVRRRRALLESRLLAVRGRWERVDGVAHLIAGDLQDLSPLLGGMPLASRDFH